MVGDTNVEAGLPFKNPLHHQRGLCLPLFLSLPRLWSWRGVWLYPLLIILGGEHEGLEGPFWEGPLSFLCPFLSPSFILFTCVMSWYFTFEARSSFHQVISFFCGHCIHIHGIRILFLFSPIVAIVASAGRCGGGGGLGGHLSPFSLSMTSIICR